MSTHASSSQTRRHSRDNPDATGTQLLFDALEAAGLRPELRDGVVLFTTPYGEKCSTRVRRVCDGH